MYIRFNIILCIVLIAQLSQAQNLSITDPSFGDNGRTSIEMSLSGSGTSDVVGRRSMHLLDDGKIIGVSTGRQTLTNFDLFVGRFSGNGAVDETFGNNGSVLVDYGADKEQAYCSAISPQNKILIGGAYYDPFGTGFPNILVVCLNMDGSKDMGFGNNGIVTMNMSTANSSSRVTDIVALDNGKMYVTFTANTSAGNPGNAFGIMKLNDDGSFDESFGDNGRVYINDPELSETAEKILVQPDEKIIVAGYKHNTGGLVDYRFIRLNTDGSIDDDFGTNGATTVSYPVGSLINMERIMFQSDGKIVVCGNYTFSPDADGIVLRLNVNGTIDQAYGTNGIATINAFSSTVTMVIDANDRIYAIGRDFADIIVIRLNTNGTIDETYGTDGKANFGGTVPSAVDICSVMQDDGKFLIGGRIKEGNIQKFGVLRAGGIDLSVDSEDIDEFIIYPNPSSTLVYLSDQHAERSEYVIRDMQGRIVLANKLTATKGVDISSLSKGVYIISINKRQSRLVIE